MMFDYELAKRVDEVATEIMHLFRKIDSEAVARAVGFQIGTIMALSAGDNYEDGRGFTEEQCCNICCLIGELTEATYK